MRLQGAISLMAHSTDMPSSDKQVSLHGLPITVEVPKGRYRILHDDSGKPVYKKLMMYSYGFFNGTKGRDGDEVDCFVGPEKDAKEVYVIHMKDFGPVPSEREDEDKCMIGFRSADAAKTAFLLHYPASFYDGMTALPVDQFKEKMAKATLPHRKKKITAGLLTVSDAYRAYNQVLDAGKCPQCGGPLRTAKTGYREPKRVGYDCVKCDRTWNRKDLEADSTGIGIVGDPAAAEHLRQMPKSPLTSGGKESAEKLLESRSVRSTLQKLVAASTASKLKCPKCASRKISLMPTDYETAKCRDCGKTFPAKQVKAGLFPNQPTALPPVG